MSDVAMEPTAVWRADANMCVRDEAITYVSGERFSLADRWLELVGAVKAYTEAAGQVSGNSQFICAPGFLRGSFVEPPGEVPVPDEGLLADSLADLEALLGEADQEVLDNARVLLPRMHRILADRYLVYVSDRGGVVIEAPMRDGASVGVECGKDDVVYCFASIGGNNRRAKFYQMDGLPDVFIEKALRDLGNAG